MPRISLTVTLLVSLVVFPGWDCGTPVLDDPGFDLWCGQKLCSWTVEQGQVLRVPTWHRSDFGVELSGDPVVISQHSDVTSNDSRCFLFEVQANRDPGVALQLELDFLDDGSVEYSQELPSDDWLQVEYRVATPAWYQGVRFIVRKQGLGHAVVSHLRATKSSDCIGPPMEMNQRANGVRCDADTQCRSGLCHTMKQTHLALTALTYSICSGCRDDGDCTGIAACGMEPGMAWWFESGMYLDCGAPGRHQLGEPCAGDKECATGVCCAGICSQCCDGAGCSGAQSCQLASWWDLGQQYKDQPLPWQCAPRQGQGAADAVCLVDADCLSGSCLGSQPLKTCPYDGRRCEQDNECHFGQTCLALGMYGGRCQ